MTPGAWAIRHLICGHTPPLPEVNFLMVEIPTPKPYIFMIRVTRQIKYLIAQALGVIPHPLPHSALKKLNTEHSIAYRCFPQASTLTFFLTCPIGQLHVTKTSCKSKPVGLVLYSAYLWSVWIDKWNAPRVEAWGHPHPLPEFFFIAEYKTRPNGFDLQLVLV
jgi:hypothetical protein